MPSNCRTLTAGIAKSCAPLTSGTKDKLALIPIDDIIALVRDTTNPKLITAIMLKSGKKAYLFEGYNNSNVIREDIVPGKYSLPYKHELDFVAFGVGPSDMETLEAVNAGTFVAVLQTNNRHFKVIGSNAGLKAVKNPNDTENKDTGGANQPSLAAENEIGYSDFFQVLDENVFDYAATVAAFDALFIAAP